MRLPPLKDRDFIKEFKFQTSRSSGPGGQNVNKVSTRVELRFNVMESQLLTEREKEILQIKLATRISQDGILSIAVQIERSQLRNKQLAIEKFFDLVSKALAPVKNADQQNQAVELRRDGYRLREGAQRKARRRSDDWD